MYSFVFGVVYNAQPPVTANGNAENFGLYLFTGLIAWSVIHRVVTGAAWAGCKASAIRARRSTSTETALLGGAVANAIQTALEAVVLLVIMALFANISWTAVFCVLAAVDDGVRARDRVHRGGAQTPATATSSTLIGVLIGVGFFLVPIVYRRACSTETTFPDRPPARDVEPPRCSSRSPAMASTSCRP